MVLQYQGDATTLATQHTAEAENEKMEVSMKTKLGISVGLLGASAYFMAMFGNYVALIVMAGYVLLSESNEWLRRTAVKALILALTIDVLCALINLLPDTFNLISSMLRVFGGSMYVEKIFEIADFLVKLVGYAGKILLLVLGFSSLKQGYIRIPVVDSILERHI